MQRKAMLTKHNKGWTFHDLLSEIEREHTYFQTMDAIRTLLVQSSELVIEAYTPASWKVQPLLCFVSIAFRCMAVPFACRHSFTF